MTKKKTVTWKGQEVLSPLKKKNKDKKPAPPKSTYLDWVESGILKQ
jgi:hypothetical protein